MTKLLYLNIDIKDVKNIYQNNETVKRLTVRYKVTDSGQIYWWEPKWETVADLFKSGHDVEVANEGGSECTFINAAFKVIEDELKRCRLEQHYASQLREIQKKVNLAASMNLSKSIKWDDSDL